MSAFATLNAVDVSEHVEQKNRLTYLSWAWAWAELKKRYPNSTYTIYETKDGCFYHTDGKTCWVKTGVTLVDGEYSLEHIEYLPVMDFKNASIPVDKVTSFEVNKAIQRSLTKAVARHGLGLYIYAGEDLPEGADKGDADPPKPKGEFVQPVTPKAMIERFCEAQNITREQYDAIHARLVADKKLSGDRPTSLDAMQAVLDVIKADIKAKGYGAA